MLRSYGAFLFLRLIIPPAVAGGIVKIVFLRGLSFFVLNYLWPDGRGFLRPAGRVFFCHFLCRKKVTKETA